MQFDIRFTAIWFLRIENGRDMNSRRSDDTRGVTDLVIALVDMRYILDVPVLLEVLDGQGRYSLCVNNPIDINCQVFISDITCSGCACCEI